MKVTIISVILLTLIAGCATVQNPPSVPTTTNVISGTPQLMFNEQELQQLGLTAGINETTRQLFGIGDGNACKTEGNYSNLADSTQGQYSICIYNIASLNNTQVVIELTRFEDYPALNGTYQYQSLHLYSSQGVISENILGDMSRFHVNNVNDYGGQFDVPGVYYYNLYFTKDLYLIHISSGGRSKDAEAIVVKIADKILSKFVY